MKTSAILTVTVIFVSIFGVLVTADTATALRVDDQCNQVEAVFVRGSGQAMGDDDRDKFLNAFDKKIPKSFISQSFYELGTESYGGMKYQAISVDVTKNMNALGAKVSSGYANDYGKSVDSGVGELYNYLTQRHAKCKSVGTKYVLGGYSQGAQVIGQALPKFTNELRQDIVFSALYGDPKLNLPEGYGVNPPACRGKDFSSWRRTVHNCRTSAGSLNARKPYLPEDMRNKTGLWCYKDDYVCGSTNNALNMAGHSLYRADGYAIDISMNEIADRLRLALPKDVAAKIPTGHDSGQGTTGLDVAYVLDTTGSMGGQIEASKEFIRKSAQKIKDLRGRVSLTVYRDSGDEYTAQIVSPLQSDTGDLLAKLEMITADGGGDTPEAGLHALMTTFNGLKWQDGATKASILVTDAPFHNPDSVDGTTIEQVAKRSLEIDPVNVYPVLSASWLSENEIAEYHKLADLTSGQVIIDEGDTVAALSATLTKIEQRPTALLKNLEYQADVGQEITFDASDSYVLDAEITRYDWDYDGDGVFEVTTTTPVVSHTYTQKFDGTMQVRLTASNGTIANASAVVEVGTYQVPIAPTKPNGLKVEVLSTTGATSTVKLSWQPSDTHAEQWNIRVNDVSLGLAVAAQRSIEITDIQRDQLVTFGVSGLSAAGVEGEMSEVTLDKQATAPAPQPPLPPKQNWWQLLVGYLLKLLYVWSRA